MRRTNFARFLLLFDQNIKNMTDELIIRQLKDKEAHLMNELNKVRLALKAFIDENIGFISPAPHNHIDTGLIPGSYNSNLTYGSKILYILSVKGKPMLVNEIVDTIHELEPGLEVSKLQKNVSYNLSMLAKYAKVNKHPFNRKIKYSL